MKITILTLLISTGALASVELTENNLTTLFQSNPEVRSLRERVEASERLRGSLTRSFLPNVELSYGRERYSVGPYDHINQPFGGIEVSLNIFNSGKDSIEHDKRELQAKITQMDAVLLEAQIVAQVRKDMSMFAYLNEVKEILTKALESNQTSKKLAASRISAGMAAKTDALDFEQQEISLKQQLSQVKYEIGLVERMILTLLGHEADTTIKISFENTHSEDSNHVTPQVKAENTLAVQKFLFSSEISKLEMKSSKRWWTPRVDIYGFAMRALQKDREYPETDQRNDVGIGFKITMPIFDGGNSYREAQANSSLARSQESMAQSRQLQMKREVVDANKKLELAHELIHGAEENVKVMGRYRQGILDEYNRGVKNSPDVLQANNRWIEANAKYAEVKRNYQMAKADALYLMLIQERK